MFKAFYLFLLTLPLSFGQEAQKIGNRANQDVSLCKNLGGGSEKCIKVNSTGNFELDDSSNITMDVSAVDPNITGTGGNVNFESNLSLILSIDKDNDDSNRALFVRTDAQGTTLARFGEDSSYLNGINSSTSALNITNRTVGTDEGLFFGASSNTGAIGFMAKSDGTGAFNNPAGFKMTHTEAFVLHTIGDRFVMMGKNGSEGNAFAATDVFFDYDVSAGTLVLGENVNSPELRLKSSAGGGAEYGSILVQESLGSSIVNIRNTTSGTPNTRVKINTDGTVELDARSDGDCGIGSVCSGTTSGFSSDQTADCTGTESNNVTVIWSTVGDVMNGSWVLSCGTPTTATPALSFLFAPTTSATHAGGVGACAGSGGDATQSPSTTCTLEADTNTTKVLVRCRATSATASVTYRGNFTCLLATGP